MGELRLVPLSAYHNDCRILEIEPGASVEEIKQAYRDQAKVWHPDRFANDLRLQKKAEEKTKQISLAYRRLCGLAGYEHHVSSPATPVPPSDWAIAVFALGRAVKHSLIIISKPFRWLLGTGVNTGLCLFQWCCREKKSLAIATTAFVLGFGFGVWFLPRDSEAWLKISGLFERATEKHGPAQPALTQASAAGHAAPVPNPSIVSSSPTRDPALSPSPFDANSDVTTTTALGDVPRWNENNDINPFSVSEQELTADTPALYKRVREKDWLQNFRAASYPRSMLGGDYTRISFIPNEISFNLAAPPNSFEEEQLDLREATMVTPSEQIYAPPDSATTQREPETVPNKGTHSATMEGSHTDTSQGDTDTSPASLKPDSKLAERKKPPTEVPIKVLPTHRAPTGRVIAGSTAKAIATYAPRPDYPEEARSRRIAGSGVCIVSIDPYSGHVTNASMAQSTGSLLLDKSVVRTLRTWKFKPGTMSQVSIPVEFSTDDGNR